MTEIKSRLRIGEEVAGHTSIKDYMEAVGLTDSIVRNLGHSNHRYRFECHPNVIDLGLRLSDVQEMNLESEGVHWSPNRQKDPGENLSKNGATDGERDFLVEGCSDHYYGQRVELNAMTSDQFIAWLETKFKEHGVTKVMPDRDTLATAWHRAHQISRMQKAIDEIKLEEAPVPQSLETQIQELQEMDETLSWDKALVQIAGKNGIAVHEV